MNDDWRVQVDLHDAGHSMQLVEQLESPNLRHDLSDAFEDRAIVSRADAVVFVYAGTREQAEGAHRLVLGLADRHGWSVDTDLKHWHPAAESWEDPDKPLPQSDAARLAEHAELMARERAETARTGRPEFEVRVDLPSRHDAVRFSEQLQKEGLPAVHRWKFLLVGATDEDSAEALAERIRDEAPAGSQVSVEGTWAAAYAERPSNPFAVLGGLGG